MPLGTEVSLGPGDIVTWGPISPLLQKGGGTAAPTFWPMYCGQTAGWIKLPLGMDIGLGLGFTVLDEDPAPPTQRVTAPIFGQCLLWPNCCVDQDATWYGGQPRPRRHCVRWGPRDPDTPKRGTPPIFGPCILWLNGWMDQDGTWYRGGPRSRPYCVDGDPDPLP